MASEVQSGSWIRMCAVLYQHCTSKRFALSNNNKPRSFRGRANTRAKSPPCAHHQQQQHGIPRGEFTKPSCRCTFWRETTWYDENDCIGLWTTQPSRRYTFGDDSAAGTTEFVRLDEVILKFCVEQLC